LKRLFLLMLVLIFAISAMTIGHADSTLDYEGATASSSVKVSIPSRFSVNIPATIYADQPVTLTAGMMSLQSNHQVNVYITNLGLNDSLTVYNEQGGSATVNFVGLEEGQRAGRFTNGDLTSKVTFHCQCDGGSAGEYTGTVEFQITLGLIEG